MIVQWCIKGLALDSDEAAHEIIDDQRGLVCSWWREVHTISPASRREKLTSANLDKHINHFATTDPATDRPYGELSPFISLTAGVVERDAAMRTNYVRRARQTALWFGSDFGQRSCAYLFLCWVIVGPRPAVEIEGVAEEVRDLNAYRRYSDYQPEGEITAKVILPVNQILGCERWDLDLMAGKISLIWTKDNRRFTEPERLTNVRELL